MKLLITFISTFILLSFVPSTKKDNLVAITKKYSPDNYVLLKDYPDAFFNQLARGDSLSDYIFGLTVIVHEAFHQYESTQNSKIDTLRLYRINDTLTISIKKFSSFACLELNKIIAQKSRQQIPRYNTYINSKDPNLDTQKNGFLGLLEEYTAYYIEFKTFNKLFSFLKDKYGFSDPELWRKYLCEISSVKYSLIEFKLFISWYLQYSKTNYPDIYKRITNDKNIRKLFSIIDSENNKLTKEYQGNRSDIIKQLGQKIKIQNGFLTVVKSDNSNGLHDIETQNLMTMLSKPEHKILNVFLDN